MVDIIIYIIVAVILFLALRASIKHFKGESTCCGSSGGGLIKTGEKKLDGPVVSTMTMRVSGMHCEECAERVKRAIDSVDGAAGSVDLKAGTATVRCDRQVDESKLRSAVREAGYTVDSIS